MLKRLTEYLDRNSIKYVQVTHSPSFTASEIAATAHLSGKDVAKTVIAKRDDTMLMLVLPANAMVDFHSLRITLAAHEVRLASENEFNALFPECEVGAMPPFGNLFGLEVIVDRALVGGHEIAFNAGNHRELIRMKYEDFERLVRPRILTFGIVRKTREDEVDIMP